MNLLDLLLQPHAAIRLVQRLQPAGGAGSKLFPPTFEGGTYSFEQRRIDGRSVRCVLLDSVASSANRQEEALWELVRDGRLALPYFEVELAGFPELGEVTTLNAPHRAFDAIFRDSELDGKPFPKHPVYAELARCNAQNATALFRHAPTALLFGAWDSTGSAGGSGNKFARCIVTEIIGVNVERGDQRGGVRNDPLAISRHVEIEIDKAGDWKPKGLATKGDERAKGTRPSEVNHGNILLSVDVETVDGVRMTKRGGITCDYAEQISVLSLTGLRRLRFPIDGRRDPAVDAAGRAVLAALGLVALVAARNRGYALRSRCDLVAEGRAPFELIAEDGGTRELALDIEAALAGLAAAVDHARSLGLDWDTTPKRMRPQPKLSKLIALSREAGLE